MKTSTTGLSNLMAKMADGVKELLFGSVIISLVRKPIRATNIELVNVTVPPPCATGTVYPLDEQ